MHVNKVELDITDFFVRFLIGFSVGEPLIQPMKALREMWEMAS